VLRSRGALFFRQLVDAVGSASVTDTDALLALWELVWAGLVTNDTLAPLRALVSGGAGRPGGRPARRRRGPAFPSRLGPPAGQGRWSLAPEREGDATRRLHAATERLLDRYGVVTRGSVVAERLPGGFAGAYAVLKAMEDRGSCRRGYFVDGLGGAQFAIPGAVDRLRAFAASARPPRDAGGGDAHVARPGHGAGHEAYLGNDAGDVAGDIAGDVDGESEGDGYGETDGDAGEASDYGYGYDYGYAAYDHGGSGRGAHGGEVGGGTRRAPVALVLAATDPANPYGAALDWPDPGNGDEIRHRAGRKAGATVVLVDGELALYLEKGGRSLLTYGAPSGDEARAAARDAAIAALGAAARQGLLGRLSLEKVDGRDVLGTPLAASLTAAGFRASSRGLRV
jgi:ATP-dependent helicase Lhr and Lhr-like helicase